MLLPFMHDKSDLLHSFGVWERKLAGLNLHALKWISHYHLDTGQ